VWASTVFVQRVLDSSQRVTKQQRRNGEKRRDGHVKNHHGRKVEDQKEQILGRKWGYLGTKLLYFDRLGSEDYGSQGEAK